MSNEKPSCPCRFLTRFVWLMGLVAIPFLAIFLSSQSGIEWLEFPEHTAGEPMEGKEFRLATSWIIAWLVLLVSPLVISD